MIGTQVGYSRLGHIDMPISGKPEIGAVGLRGSYDTIGMGFVEGSDIRKSVLARLRQRLKWPARASAKAGPKRWRESHVRSVMKAISWRATGSLDTFLVTLIITGSSVLAGSVAVTEIATKIVFYYGHERIWAMIPWGKD